MTLLDLSNFEAIENLSAEQLVRSTMRLDGKACLTNSFQLEDMIVLCLLREVDPHVPVLFLDTGYHFAETYEYRDRMTRAWNLNLRSLHAEQSVAEQEAAFGILNQADPGRCCAMRKVDPLMRGLVDYDIWFTGLRREQSPTRKNLRKVEHHTVPGGKTLLKISPLADWTTRQVWSYTIEHQIEYLPLYDKGYASIGCEPCTSIPQDPANPRSGRWLGRKLECGIHTFTEKDQVGKIQ